MSPTASRVAARYLTALSKEMANAFYALVRSAVPSAMNWSWDVKNADDESPGFGWGGKTFSFPGKPDEFDSAGILGGILVKGSLSSEPAPGQAATVTLEVGYYHKLKGGEGKYGYAQPLGTFDVTLDASGVPSFVQGQNTGSIGAGVKKLVDAIVKSPPATSLSKSKKNVQNRKYQEMAEQQTQRRKDELEADKDTHGTPESFFDHIVEDSGGEFGPRDVARLMEVTGEKDRAGLMKKLQEFGLIFNPKKTTLSSGPCVVSAALKVLAARVASSPRPSASRTAAAVRAIIGLVG